MKIDFNNVRYSRVDIDHEFASIGGFGKSSQPDKGYTDISKVTGDIGIKSGVAQTSNLQALLNIGQIGATGTANLVSQALGMRVTAVLSKDASQKAGGTNVAGFMQTALANSQSELVIPAIVTGTFQHPHYAPDLHQIEQMKLRGLIPSFSNPSQGVSGLVGGLVGQKSGNPAQANQQQQNPAQQLMGILGAKQK